MEHESFSASADRISPQFTMSASASRVDEIVEVGASASAREDVHDGDDKLTATLSESGSQGSQASTFEIYYHGTCPGCHHWYDKVTIRLFRNIRKHKRFRCTRCKRPLFGLGGNSTQTTLASQETTSRHESWGSALGGSSGFHGCTNMTTDGNLGTIAELSPSQQSAVSRQPSQRSAASRHPSNSSLQLPRASSSVHSIQPQPTSLYSAMEDRLAATAGEDLSPKATASAPPHLGRFRKIKSNADRLFRKVKEIKTRISRPLQIGRERSRNKQIRRYAPNVGLVGLRREISSASRQTAVDPVVSSRESSQRASGQPLTTRVISSAETQNTRPDSTYETSRAEHLDQSNKLSQVEKLAAKDKHERIRRIRREKTLREKVLQKPRCECTEGCQCMKMGTQSCSSGEGQRRSVCTAEIEAHRFPTGVEPPDATTTSSTMESRRLSSDVASDSHHHSFRRFELAGIGDHLADEQRRSSQETTSTRFGGRARPSSSFSQAPTVISTESSISLTGSLANIFRRSAGSRPHTPHLQVVGLEANDDDEEGGPTPTQRSTTMQRTLRTAEEERTVNTSSTLLELIEDEIHDRSLVDHDGAFLPN